MRRDRIEELARFLLNRVPDDRFDLSAWGQKGFAEHECGTAACALGWATVCFPEDGLRMDYSEASARGGTVLYGNEVGFAAARSFFEIPLDHATRLLATPGSREEVARRLLAYVNNPDGVYRSLIEQSSESWERRERRALAPSLGRRPRRNLGSLAAGSPTGSRISKLD